MLKYTDKIPTGLTNSKNLPMGDGRPTCNRVLTSGSVGMGIEMPSPRQPCKTLVYSIRVSQGSVATRLRCGGTF